MGTGHRESARSKAMRLLKSLTSERKAGLQRAEERTTIDEVDERGQGLSHHAKALASVMAEGLNILAVQALRTGVWIPEPTSKSGMATHMSIIPALSEAEM